MDESGDFYGYKFPSESLESNLDLQYSAQRRCTVRGCGQMLDANSPNKMCESCRGKHRRYASTKRARRKLEKAAISGQTIIPIEQIPGSTAWMPGNASVNEEDNQPDSQSIEPMDPPPQTFTAAFASEALSQPGTSSSWDASTIDPRLFRSQSNSSSSELAGALTLPAPTKSNHYKPPTNEYSEGEPLEPRASYYRDPPPEPPPKKRKRRAPSVVLPEVPTTNEDGTPSLPPRFCSVKGCKTIIAGSYAYKMCEPCRNRYRSYGITKRAKWKAERAAFEQELETLREVEDEKRKNAGLAPLSESPEDLQAWEMSIIDEKVTVPQDITGLLTAYSSLSPATLIRATGSQQPIGSPLVSTSSTAADQPAAAAVNHFFPPVPVLPPRMCTVSHCHKILPGHYMFKRCEQHRLQNRHHSKLKRVREKVVKSAGPPEGSIGETFEQGRDDSADPEDEKIEDIGAESETDISSVPFIPDKEGRRSYSCTAKDCHNLIGPGVRWRMCDPCRVQRKALQARHRAEVEQELRNAEKAWRLQAQTDAMASASPSVHTPVAGTSGIDADMANVSGTGDALINSGENANQPIAKAGESPMGCLTPNVEEPRSLFLNGVEPNPELSAPGAVEVAVQEADSILAAPITPAIDNTERQGPNESPKQITDKEAMLFTPTVGEPIPSATNDGVPPARKKRKKKTDGVSTSPIPPTTPAPAPKASTSASSQHHPEASHPIAYPYPPPMPAQYPYPYYIPPYSYGMPPPAPAGSGEYPVYANAQPYMHPYPYPYPPPYPIPPSQYPYPSRYYPPYGAGHYPSYSRPVTGSSSVSAPVPPGPFIPTPAQTVQQSSSQPSSSTKTSSAKQSSPQTKPAASSNPPTSSNSTQPTLPTAQSGNLPTAMPPPPPHPHHNVFRPSPYTSMSTEPPLITDPAVQASTSQNRSFNYYNPDAKVRKRKAVDGELNILIQVPRGAPAPSSTTLTNRFMKEPATKEVSMDSLEIQTVPTAPVVENLPSNPRPAPADNEPTTLPARACANNKSCNRTIPGNVQGTLCEKCKIRIKKHQAKAKQKYKLEPRKAIVATSIGGATK
ncbi:hypothetical protein ARMGADRAFT_1011701 [Armillaria gallica]|uniref:Uncharacterized protein n=1 Tax=Armillaria gallica TaxID=47427 RepID=A0A2H3DHX2_ARMGA|nr:hypothetical protein ARMGADRAFT_1011701 [Armillaria gallica]